jgi:nicotinamide riboside kinase
MIKVGFCGGPGSGKTCLARAVANKFCMDGYIAEYVSEYARFHISQCTRAPHNAPRDLLHQQLILQNQLQWEDAVQLSAEFMITDSPIITGAVYAYLVADFQNHNQKTFYFQYYQKIVDLKDRYDYLFFLPSDVIEFQSDGLRTQDIERARDIGERIKAFMTFHSIRWYEVKSVALEDRVKECCSIVHPAWKDILVKGE